MIRGLCKNGSLHRCLVLYSSIADGALLVTVGFGAALILIKSGVRLHIANDMASFDLVSITRQ